MARINRREVLSEGEIQVVHCVNRVVRRGFLCGTDELTGQNYENRREWIRKRLEFLAGVFGIDILGFSVMSNHLHAILRNRPDVVKDWTRASGAIQQAHPANQSFGVWEMEFVCSLRQRICSMKSGEPRRKKPLKKRLICSKKHLTRNTKQP